MLRATRAVVVALSASLALAPARADEPPAAPSETGVDPDTDFAMREFRRGLELYQAERYDEAIAAFEHANTAKPRPAFDYNIARCHDRLGHWQEALTHYERYLASPDAAHDPEADATRARVAELRARLAAATPATPATPAAPPVAAPAPAPALAPLPPPHEASHGRAMKIAGAVTAAVGGAALVTGIACGVLAKQASDDISAAGRAHGAYDSSRYQAGQRDQAAEVALLVTGGVALAAGVVVYALGARHARRARAALSPARGATTAMGFSF